jgi:hypothetical protein
MNGALVALVLVLAYALVVECMMAAIVLLSEFILLRIRSLRALLKAPTKSSGELEPAGEPYKVGGGLMRWD